MYGLRICLDLKIPRIRNLDGRSRDDPQHKKARHSCHVQFQCFLLNDLVALTAPLISQTQICSAVLLLKIRFWLGMKYATLSETRVL